MGLKKPHPTSPQPLVCGAVPPTAWYKWQHRLFIVSKFPSTISGTPKQGAPWALHKFCISTDHDNRQANPTYKISRGQVLTYKARLCKKTSETVQTVKLECKADIEGHNQVGWCTDSGPPTLILKALRLAPSHNGTCPNGPPTVTLVIDLTPWF